MSQNINGGTAVQDVNGSKNPALASQESLERMQKIPVLQSQKQIDTTQDSETQSAHQISDVASESSSVSLKMSTTPRRGRADRAKSGMLPVSEKMKEHLASMVHKKQEQPTAAKSTSNIKTEQSPISASFLRVRNMAPTANIENENPFTFLPIDEEKMILETNAIQGGPVQISNQIMTKVNLQLPQTENQKIHATSKFSNDAWFDKMGIDKAIAKALKNGYNLCTMIYGKKGSGKDYCLVGGLIQTDSANSQGNENKHREPGLIRLAYEAVVAQICINKNAQFSIQLSCGVMQDEEVEDLQSADQEFDGGLQRKSIMTRQGQIKDEYLTRKHCNSIKQLSQLLQQIHFRQEQMQPRNETVIMELVIEKFSLDPADYNQRTTQTKLCFIRLPPSDLKFAGGIITKNAFQRSLMHIQQRSLRAFQTHVLGLQQKGSTQVTKNHVEAVEPASKSKLIKFLLDEAYFEQQVENKGLVSISDLCFINCCHIDDEEDSKQVEHVEECIKLVQRVQEFKFCPKKTVLQQGTSVIEHLQRSRRIKAALIDAIVEKMKNQAVLSHTEDFQKLFYDRIRFNKQLQNIESNILMADTFKRQQAHYQPSYHVTPKLIKAEELTGLKRANTCVSKADHDSMGKKNSLLLTQKKDADISDIAAKTPAESSESSDKKQTLEFSRKPTLSINDSSNGKPSNAVNRMSMRFKSALAYQQEQQDVEVSSRQQKNAMLLYQPSSDRAQTQTQPRNSIVSHITDATVDQDQRFTSSRINYEKKEQQLESLLIEDHREELTTDIVAGGKSPNRLGTRYQNQFVQKAITNTPQDSNNKFQMFPHKIVQVENGQDQDERFFDTTRRKSDGFYATQGANTGRHSEQIELSSTGGLVSNKASTDSGRRQGIEDVKSRKSEPVDNHRNNLMQSHVKKEKVEQLQQKKPQQQHKTINSQEIDDKTNDDKAEVSNSNDQIDQDFQVVVDDGCDLSDEELGESKEVLRKNTLNMMVTQLNEEEGEWRGSFKVMETSQATTINDEDETFTAAQIQQTDPSMEELFDRNFNRQSLASENEAKHKMTDVLMSNNNTIAVLEDDLLGKALDDLLYEAENDNKDELFDVEDFLSGGEALTSDDPLSEATDFMVRNKAKLERLNSIRLSKNGNNAMLSSARLSQCVKAQIIRRASIALQPLQTAGKIDLSDGIERKPTVLFNAKYLDKQLTTQTLQTQNTMILQTQNSFFDEEPQSNDAIIDTQHPKLKISSSKPPKPELRRGNTSLIGVDSPAQSGLRRDNTLHGAEAFDPEELGLDSSQKEELQKDDEMFHEFDRMLMMEREKVLKQADQKIQMIHKTHRDSVLRGRGYSMRLDVAPGISIIKEEEDHSEVAGGNGESTLLDDDGDDDLLLGGEESDLLADIEQFESHVITESNLVEEENDQKRPTTATDDFLDDMVVQIYKDDDSPEEDNVKSEDIDKNRKSKIVKLPSDLSELERIMVEETLGKASSKRKSQANSSGNLQSLGAVPCKKCKIVKKVKTQLKEKTQELADTQEKLQIQQEETNEMKQSLQEALQYIDYLEKQQQQALDQSQQDSAHKQLQKDDENQQSPYQLALDMPTIAEGEDEELYFEDY